MYTQCPGCGTIFALRAWQLRRARGQVTCGLCLTTFDAVEALTETLPGADDDRAPAADRDSAPAEGAPEGEAGVGEPTDGGEAPSPAPQAGDVEVTEAADSEARGAPPPGALDAAHGGSSQESGAGRAEQPPAGADEPDWEQLLAEFRGQPERPAPAAAPPRRRRGRWAAAITVVLLAGALVHGSYAYRLELVEIPGARPWLEAVCAVYGCRLEVAEDYDVITVEERWLERHPRREDALLLGGELVHTGERRLAYPELQLTLRDLDGHVTGRRWVRPAEYVADSRMRAQLDAGMEPGDRVPVRVAVAEPDGGAESFSLAFRPPRAD